MPRKSLARKKIERLARIHSPGFPVGTIAYYGPNDQFASKAVVGILEELDRILALERWFATAEDVRLDEWVCEQIAAFLDRFQVSRVSMVDQIIGCPHEEGIDYPTGEACPECVFWKGRDRWSGQSRP